ncbi:rRNA methyltransferase Spb1 [Schizosaccharomyces cryophilus OY26]|uniref:rRNA methyltransferase Spb1 n=1 Tax=Schizosaccharomyces cryophilus (strain OY26 / ATCC MYA-4695 / CBS 11777 / NBRC 106824 / NRRL Y48691) TaxID=653667 RepID=S9VS29_SCHCR|nr:rRNA methyltransferase Spb1 [Schizosaccharomyces cryophilus OY26]EPY50738.1 rRNA methyltransferase Spb1 [Schizosaccharomyces cryophilus OY26]
MGKTQKKSAKGRLDKWYKLAKEQGYRSRAAFKLVQLNQKFNFLEKAKVVIDLCAAPGGWLQVASRACKPGSLLVGVDLTPIRPVPNCQTFVEDITSDKCRSQLRGILKTWKADVVLHDGAPNVGAAWLQDAYGQAELVLMSMKLACEFLVPGGTFVTKVFRSRDYNNLLWVFKQLFNRVDATKPPSSRNVSAEIFVVCRGYKAPQKLDPRFTDPRTVFEEVTEPTPNVEAKVFEPEKKKRNREGYADNDYTLHKTVPASDFVKGNDPIQVLGTSAEIVFPEEDEDSQRLKNSEATDEDILIHCSDLQVLGKKDFRELLKWRLKVRNELGLGKRPETEQKTVVEEIPEVDEETKMDQELQHLNETERTKVKRERRRANKRKQREIIRMQMGMEAPMEIGMEQSTMGDDSMFGLSTAEKHGLNKLTDASTPEVPPTEEENEVLEENEEEYDSEDEQERLEAELDSMYSQYTERKAESDVKYKVKRSRGDADDEEWEGIQEQASENEEDEPNEASVEEDEHLLTSLDKKDSGKNGLSKKASLFFDQDIFEGIGNDDDADKEIVAMNSAAKAKRSSAKANENESSDEEEKTRKGDIEVVPPVSAQEKEDDWDSDSGDDGENVDIVTAEAMTLAQEIASRKKSTSELIDDGYNRWTFQPKDGLPDWFVDEENHHNKPNKPITKEAVMALREKMKAINARPIKKILEAQGRKKMRTVRRMQNVAKKAEGITESGEMTEGEKSKEISRLMSRAMKAKPKQKATLVVAKGANRGIQSRPKGVKGKYKMVDSRMKKDLRAQKRLEKKKRK